MSISEVTLKKLEPMTIASIREVLPGYEDMAAHYGELFAYLGQNQVAPAGPPFAMYHDEGYKPKDVDLESAVPIAGPAPSGERVKVRELSAVEQAACLTVEGSYEQLSDAYTRLLGWIESNGYQIVDCNREIYVKGGPDFKPEEYVTELQFPVRKV